MRSFGEKRPGNIECDNIWELYKKLVTLDDPYIKTRLKGDDTEYMYLIMGACLEAGDTKYRVNENIGWYIEKQGVYIYILGDG